MRLVRLSTLALLGLLAFGVPWPAAAATLFGLRDFFAQPNENQAKLIGVNPANGSTRVRGTVAPYDYPRALAFGDAGVLYGLVEREFDESQLVRINRSNGATTVLHTLPGLPANEGAVSAHGLAYDHNTNRLLTVAQNRLYEIDPGTGAATPGAMLSQNVLGLAIGRGKLYGVGSASFAGDSYYEIDRATGTSNLIGEVSIFGDTTDNVAYSNGTLFSVADGILAALDLDAVEASGFEFGRRVAPTTQVHALAAPVPLPAAGLLLPAGFALFGLLRRGSRCIA